MTLDLFTRPAPVAAATPPAPPGPPPLRDYQIAAVESVRRELAENRGTLVLLATGLGKTQIACELIRTWPGRACFIAHRSELIDQASKRVEQFTGAAPQIEKAERHALLSGNTPVIASVQTLSKEKRISRFARDAFSLIVIDEVHHATSPTYRAVIDRFSGAKIVGLTATPDRLDGAALGQVLDSVAYRYELAAAIADGWLAPIKMRTVKVDGVDFSEVRTVAGDFNQGQLDEIMAREESLHGVAKPAVEMAGDRPTIVFTTSIENARLLAEVVDRYAGRKAAVAIDSTLDDTERKRNLRMFETGERQFLVNVGIATEGYDYPPTSCIVLGRPTKSRALAAQMIGRGTRGGPMCPIEGKTDLLVIDFRGVTEDHDIMTAVDALAGDLSDDQIAEAKREVEKAEAPMSLEEALAKAAERARLLAEQAEAMRARREHIKAQVTYREFDPNPFVNLGIKRDYLHERYGYAAASEKQVATLQKMAGKYAKDLPKNLGKLEASRMLGEMIKRSKAGRCTYPQLCALQKQGINAKAFSFEAAHRVLDALASNRWRALPPERIAELTGLP